MVPIVRSFWLPHGHDLAGDIHYSEQNVVNGILICAGGTVTGSGAADVHRKRAFYRISSRAVFLNQLLKRPAYAEGGITEVAYT
jgi:hypothetical protein